MTFLGFFAGCWTGALLFGFGIRAAEWRRDHREQQAVERMRADLDKMLLHGLQAGPPSSGGPPNPPPITWPPSGWVW